MKRFGMVIGVKKEKLDYYKQLHANPWPEVLNQIDRSNVRNFSIWLVEMCPEQYYLFGHFDYTGDDFAADMAAMDKDATTKRWLKEIVPCQKPIPTAKEGEQWVMMQEVFYYDKDHRGTALMSPPPKFEVGKAE